MPAWKLYPINPEKQVIRSY